LPAENPSFADVNVWSVVCLRMVGPVKRLAAALHSPASRAKNNAPSAEGLAGACFDAPFGKLAVVASDVGIRSIGLGHSLPANAASVELIGSCGGGSRAQEHVRLALEQLGEYFARKRTSFTLPLDACGTEFQLMAWSALRRIPFGTTSSYVQVLCMCTAVRSCGTETG
jgi:hypothetical protein